MRICFVSHHSEAPDEGVRKAASCLFQEISKKHQSIRLSIANPISWYHISTFRPDIIHFYLSPTVLGLNAAKLASVFYLKAKTIISACHPAGLSSAKWLSFAKPDLVLIQSPVSEKKFNLMGYKTQFLPNGVDVAKFTPISMEHRQTLRKKYGLREDAFVILHVASIKRARNLGIFKQISRQNSDFQVVIIGRVGEKRDEKLASELQESGCLVWKEYFPNMEEIYATTDCYIFPTIDSMACIETPLSVLEAMACNIPIITSRFGALPNMFSEGDGLFFTGSDEQITELVNTIHQKYPIATNTREKVIPFSWQNISKELNNIYKTL